MQDLPKFTQIGNFDLKIYLPSGNTGCDRYRRRCTLVTQVQLSSTLKNDILLPWCLHMYLLTFSNEKWIVEKNSPMLKTKQLNRFSVSLKQTVPIKKFCSFVFMASWFNPPIDSKCRQHVVKMFTNLAQTLSDKHH
jgi:hypothetical protein